MLLGFCLSLGLSFAPAVPGADGSPLESSPPEAEGQEEGEAIPPLEVFHDVRDIILEPPALTSGLDPEASELFLERGTRPCVRPSPELILEYRLALAPRLERGSFHAAVLAAWLRTHVDPEVWEENDGYVNDLGNRLAVTASEETQAEVRRFLEALRAWRGRSFRVEIAGVPESELGPLAERVGESLEPGEMDLVLERAGERARYASFVLRDGQSTRRLVGRVRATLGDSEVNQTGMIPVTHPVIGFEPLGTCFEAAIAVAGPGPRVLVRAIVSEVVEEGEVEVRSTPLGQLELLGVRRDAMDATVLLPVGKTLIFGRTREGLGEGPPHAEAWLLRVHEVVHGVGTERDSKGREERSADLGQASAASDRLVHAVHDGAWLLWPGPGESSSIAGFSSATDATPPPSDASDAPIDEQLVEALWAGLLAEVGHDAERARITVFRESLLVTGTPAFHQALDRRLDERLRGRTILARVRLEVREEVTGAEAAPPAAPEARLLAMTEIAGVPGFDLRAFAHGARQDLADCAWLGSACFGVNPALTDPVVAATRTGLSVRLQPRAVGLPNRLGLDLDLSLERRGREGMIVCEIANDVQRWSEDRPAGGARWEQELTRLFLPWEVDRVRVETGGVRGRFLLEPGRSIALGRESPAGGSPRIVTATADWVRELPAKPTGPREAR